jgi:hypothetical protein
MLDVLYFGDLVFGEKEDFQGGDSVEEVLYLLDLVVEEVDVD